MSSFDYDQLIKDVEKIHENSGRLSDSLVPEEIIDYDRVLVKMNKLWKSWKRSAGRHGLIQEMKLMSLRSEAEAYVKKYIHIL